MRTRLAVVLCLVGLLIASAPAFAQTTTGDYVYRLRVELLNPQTANATNVFKVRTSNIAALEPIEELNIGHAIVSRAVLVGMERAVREMLAAIRG